MATIRFYLKELKLDKEAAVMLRFTIDRDHRFKLATGERILPSNWDAKNQQAKSKWVGSLLFNQALLRIKTDLIQLYRDNKSSSIEELQSMARSLVTFGTIDAPEKKSLFPIFQKFLNQYKADKDIKTVKKYEALYKNRIKEGKMVESGKLFEFNPNLSIDQLDNNFFDAFKSFLFLKGLLDSTVYKYFTNLSTFLTWADARGYEVHQTKGKPTHKAWKIITQNRFEPITLTLAELEKLETLQINEALISKKLPPQKHGRRGERTVKALTVARDAFILECRTCQRISDLKTFDLRDVVDGVWRNRVTKGSRLHGTVTRIPFNTSFTSPAWAILQKYKFQFPEISEQKINENIKTVCMLAGIDQEITQYRWKENRQVEISGPKYSFISTHCGRKTFITLALQFMKPKLVKDLAGISWSTLKHYEGHSEDETLIAGLNSIPTTNQMKIA